MTAGPLPAAESTVLRFDRTVDRGLLHRSALCEVFLTDTRRVDDTSYAAAAQLPPAHRYYTDHLNTAGVPDPILLLECCRQAETYGGHAYFGVDDETVFILKRWSMSLRPDAQVDLKRPGELVMQVHTAGVQAPGGRLRGLTYSMDMTVDGQDVGTTSMDVGYLPTEVYHHLRSDHEGRSPARSDAAHLRAVDRDEPVVAPHTVGRQLPDNVLLIEQSADRHYRIRRAFDHSSLFDHPQDHLPGLVMTDAARQAAVHSTAADTGLPAAQLTVTGFDGSFSRYAEVDRPTELTVTSTTPDVAGGFAVEVLAQQADAVITRFSIALSVAGGTESPEVAA